MTWDWDTDIWNEEADKNFYEMVRHVWLGIEEIGDNYIAYCPMCNKRFEAIADAYAVEKAMRCVGLHASNWLGAIICEHIITAKYDK